MVIIIPAYNPDYHLLDVVDSLKCLNNKIIVINDGSDSSCSTIFDKIKNDVILINHDINMGKGSAMKTGMKYVYDNMHEDGIVFVDADHQHKCHDVKRVIESFYQNSNSLILGVRVFDKDVPIRSRLGNIITRNIFKLCTGKYVSDTQTGLRSLNTKYIQEMLKIEGNKYEYEMSMLLFFAKNKIRIVEVPIETVYENKKNKTSHFKPFRDSILIYKILLKRKK